MRRGYQRWRAFRDWRGDRAETDPQDNPLLQYFAGHREGRGIWKFNHYFAAYDRHFSRFRGRNVHILEIGIYSGGSLDMWRSYFGPQPKIYGVDIEPSCKAYESDSVRVFIGDQADRSFWRRVREEVPDLDQLKPQALWAAPAEWCPNPERTISLGVKGNSPHFRHDAKNPLAADVVTERGAPA